MRNLIYVRASRSLFFGVVALASNITLCAQSSGSFAPLSNTISTPRPFDPGSNTTNPSALAVQAQNPFLGSVPLQPLVPGVMKLSLHDAIALALKANLGLVDSEQDHAQSRALRMRALSALLPQLSVDAVQSFRNFPVNTIGGQKLGLPNMIPMYSYQSAHINYSQDVLDMTAIHEVKAAGDEERVSEASLADARNIVVLAASSGYLEVVAGQSRVTAAQAERNSAAALDTLVKDRVRREVSPEIDAIRAHVAYETADQRLTLAKVRFERDKLALTRIIGLQPEQEVALADSISFLPQPEITIDDLVTEAQRERDDLKAAAARVAMARQQVSARNAERLPVVDLHAYGGGAGVNIGSFYGDYEVAGRVSVPIFTGRKIESDIAATRAVLKRRQAEFEDLKARVKYDVRSAYLDLEASSKSVDVARGNLTLADEGLKQSKDRFDAGVANSLELIQAQQAVADAIDNNIASIFAHNLAKLMLIRATGTALQDYPTYLGVK